MWKGRAVVASAVGGIPDQIEDGVNGLLVRDPTSLDEFAAVLCQPLADDDLARRLGECARETVRQKFLGIRHLEQYADLIGPLMRATSGVAAHDHADESVRDSSRGANGASGAQVVR
jgi:trehalose synthase